MDDSLLLCLCQLKKKRIIRILWFLNRIRLGRKAALFYLRKNLNLIVAKL